jgi:hypothetical protein
VRRHDHRARVDVVRAFADDLADALVAGLVRDDLRGVRDVFVSVENGVKSLAHVSVRVFAPLRFLLRVRDFRDELVEGVVRGDGVPLGDDVNEVDLVALAREVFQLRAAAEGSA